MGKIIFLLSLLPGFLSLQLNAQQAGKIYFPDSTVLDVMEFSRIRTELYYYRKTHVSSMVVDSPGDFIREYKPSEIHEIKFKYEKGKGTDQFYYLLIIEGKSVKGKKFRKKIKTWDWLEICPQNSVIGSNMDIIFFTEKKKPEIVKIELK
jgi:hypothetical protein